MTPRLAVLYPAPRASAAPPAIFTARTVALPVAASLAALALGLVHAWSGCIALAATATVWIMQLVAPSIRRWSLSMGGWVAEILFAAPFVLFFLPYVVWTAVVRPPFHLSWVGVAVAVAVAVVVYASDWTRLRPGFDRELLELLPPLRLITAALRGYQLLAAAIGQELFYRGVIIWLLAPALGWGVVPVSAALFVLEHVGNRWASAVFDRAYLCRIAALSAVLAAIAYATGSLWAAVLGHVVYNMFPVAQLAWRYRANPYRSSAPTS